MKYVISLTLGVLAGAALFLAIIYYNPFTKGQMLSPLSISENEIIGLNYSAVPRDALVYTNSGEARVAPYPEKVQQFWEPTLRNTGAFVTVLSDSRQQPTGIGVKFFSRSEDTQLLRGQALVDSVWHVFLPGRGSLFVQQTENHWDFLREIIIPARWSSANNWRGNWHGNITHGPGVLGTALVVGGSGRFETLETEAVESLNAKAYSVDRGPVAMTGRLTIEVPRQAPSAGIEANAGTQ